MAFGKVKVWYEEKKFGFIESERGDLFFHISELPPGHVVQVGEILKYTVSKDGRGRDRAVNINNSQAIKKSLSSKPNSNRRTSSKSSKSKPLKQMVRSDLLRYAGTIPLIILFIVIALWEDRAGSGKRSTHESTVQSPETVRYESGSTVSATGEVVRILSDDNDGSRHQRFIIQVPGRTLLVAHNIDLAPRIPNLHIGDEVSFSGVYEPNDKGGVIHWTHKDPRGRHPGGWLRHKGRVYQ